MMYKKICIIDQKIFYAIKINKVFCSKRCANRARYLPKNLVASLIHRNSVYTMKADGYVAMVEDRNGNEVSVGEHIKAVSSEHPLGKEEGLLIAAALVAKDEREAENRRKQKEVEDKKLKEQEQQKSLESNSGFSTVDTAVNTTTNNLRDSEVQSEAGRVMLSGVQDHEDITQIVGGSNSNQKQQKYKIRPINQEGG
jgi:hypothetical protein